MLKIVDDPWRRSGIALAAWVALLIAMLVLSGGQPSKHDWYIVIALGLASVVGLMVAPKRDHNEP